jgi:hypothetical protein
LGGGEEPLMRFVRNDVREPRRFSEKRPRTFVLALCSIPAADLSKNQHLRDFWSFSISDFFNSIDPILPSTAICGRKGSGFFPQT